MEQHVMQNVTGLSEDTLMDTVFSYRNDGDTGFFINNSGGSIITDGGGGVGLNPSPPVLLALEMRVARTIWVIWTPVILLLGGFGNVATVCVMHRIKDHNSSQHVILMALAVCDFVSLYVGALRQWLFVLFQVDLYDVHTAVCCVCWWMIYGSCTSSSWLLTCVTVQRTMAVKWPHRMRAVCSVRRTWCVIAALVALAFLLNSHFLLGMEIANDGRCNYRWASYGDFVTGVWSWVDLLMFSLLPSLCLLLCDGMLSLTLFKATSTAASMMTPQLQTANAVSSIHHNSSNNNNNSSNKNNSSSNNCSSSKGNSARRRTASKTTVMILMLSITFLLLTMPVSVYLIWSHNLSGSDAQDRSLWSSDGLAFAVTMLLWYTNCAVNFLLYTCTGSKFRQHFVAWVTCRGRKAARQHARKLSAKASSSSSSVGGGGGGGERTGALATAGALYGRMGKL